MNLSYLPPTDWKSCSPSRELGLIFSVPTWGNPVSLLRLDKGAVPIGLGLLVSPSTPLPPPPPLPPDRPRKIRWAVASPSKEPHPYYRGQTEAQKPRGCMARWNCKCSPSLLPPSLRLPCPQQPWVAPGTRGGNFARRPLHLSAAFYWHGRWRLGVKSRAEAWGSGAEGRDGGRP